MHRRPVVHSSLPLLLLLVAIAATEPPPPSSADIHAQADAMTRGIHEAHDKARLAMRRTDVDESVAYMRKTIVDGLLRQWWTGLNAVQRRSPLVRYYGAQLLQIPHRNWAALYAEVDQRRADTGADFQATIGQARRIFAAAQRDGCAGNADFYARQLDDLVVAQFELMRVVHETYWDTLDEFADKGTARFHRLVEAADAVAI